MKVSPIVLRSLFVAASLFATITARGATIERPISSVSYSATIADASAVATKHADMQILRIEGKSMLPFFGDGSVVIVKKIEAAKLSAGMVVVYHNRFGETVAHRLIAQTSAGWVAQGYNNSAADSTVVNADNLMGVVYATFHSNGQINGLPNLASLTGNMAVALAAPAK